MKNNIDFSPLEKLWGNKQEDPKLTQQNKDVRTPLISKNGQNYRTIYRAVCNFHERHVGSQDWNTIQNDMATVSAEFNSEFANLLLIAVFEELEREARKS